jgi:hypothetical protein
LELAQRSAAARGLLIIGSLPKPFKPQIFRQLQTASIAREAPVRAPFMRTAVGITEAEMKKHCGRTSSCFTINRM